MYDYYSSKYIENYENNDFFKIINNLDLLNESPDIINNTFNDMNNRTIISLTTIPSRFISDDFDLVINSLDNQLLQAEVIINISKQYKRQFTYNKEVYNNKLKSFTEKYKNVKINYCNDYGPATKLLGLIENYKFNDNDIIIIVDDDLIMNNKMTLYYNLVYQLYHCDCVGINQNKNNSWNKNIYEQIFYNNYKEKLYGWLSWSIKFKHLHNIILYYEECIRLDDNMWKHDDLFFTMFYKKNNLYACGINLFLIDKYTSNDENNALRNDDYQHHYRNNLEQKFNIGNYVINYIISNNIPKRNLLFNINNITYDLNNNNYQERHLDIKYINKNVFALTITRYSENNNANEKYILNNNELNLNIIYDRQTFFIKTTFELIKEPHIESTYTICQTYDTNKIDSKKLYSICSILSNVPSINYLFFNNNDIINYIKTNYPKCLDVYMNLIPGAYKADVFRVMYAYLNDTIYFDCKMILFIHESSLLKNKEDYVKDIRENDIYNGFFIVNKNNEKIQKILLKCLDNIFKTKYNENPLSITGPKVWGSYISEYLYKNHKTNDNWKQNVIIDKNTSQIIAKISYPEYYEINNYFKIKHYSKLWYDKKVYHKMADNYYHKLNGINYILWINLDRAPERKEKMENQLKNINIPNIRVSGIDGKKYTNHSQLTNLKNNHNLTIYEIACTLSHLKAISMAQHLDGEYFLILEDDVLLENIIYINSLKEIIKNAPHFDILMISKIVYEELENLYTKWNKYIYGTQAYIITKTGINKLLNKYKYNSSDNMFIFSNDYISPADVYVYEDCITYMYKYNIISELGTTSYIHEDHLQQRSNSINLQNEIIVKDYFLKM